MSEFRISERISVWFEHYGSDWQLIAQLLQDSQLPKGFAYPREFLRVLDLGPTDLEPWWIFDGDLLLNRAIGMKVRHPNRVLVPFARRRDNDDVACWDVATPNSSGVIIIHDYAADGWESVAEPPDFHAWLRRAVDHLIAFE